MVWLNEVDQASAKPLQKPLPVHLTESSAQKKKTTSTLRPCASPLHDRLREKGRQRVWQWWFQQWEQLSEVPQDDEEVAEGAEEAAENVNEEEVVEVIAGAEGFIEAYSNYSIF